MTERNAFTIRKIGAQKMARAHLLAWGGLYDFT